MVKKSHKDNNNSKKLKNKKDIEEDAVEEIDADSDIDLELDDIEDVEDDELPEDVKAALGLDEEEKKKTKPVTAKGKEDYISDHEMQFLRAMEENTFDPDEY